MEHDGSADEYVDDLEAEGTEEVKVQQDVDESDVSQVGYEPQEEAVCQQDDAPAALVDENTTQVEGDRQDPVDEAVDLSVEKAEDIDEVSTPQLLSGAEVGLSAEIGQPSTCQEESKQQPLRRGPKNCPGRAEAKDLEIAALTKKLNQSKKVNAELYTQLQRFNTNEVVLQLENRLKEKQKRIEELVRENRTLKNSERTLMKEVEDIQNSKDNFLSKKRALQEDLRVCKERIKQLKELYRAADEKGFKLHQQSFDLAVKNKGLTEKVRILEGVSASASLLSPAPSSIYFGVGAPMEGTSTEDVQAIIASQEEEITRLHQRVALMKKTHKAEQAKYERLLKASQDEIEQTHAEMEEFYQQLFAKERAARVQFLHMKKLKHALHELALTQQTNQRFQPFLANREMRITNRSSRPPHNQAGSHSPQKGPVLNPGRWIHEALHHLGFVMPPSSNEDESTKSPIGTKPDDQPKIPSNCIQGKLVPFPPPSTVGFAASTRTLVYNRSTPDHHSGSGTKFNYDQPELRPVEQSEENHYFDATVTGRETVPHTPENHDEELGWEE